LIACVNKNLFCFREFRASILPVVEVGKVKRMGEQFLLLRLLRLLQMDCKRPDTLFD
jgi:hypothetical protein